MAKRIYAETAKKWAVKAGIPITAGLVFIYIMYTISIGAMVITDTRWSNQCAGTLEEPCWVEYDFYVNEDVFWYPMDYDPWGRETAFQFNPELESWKLKRSWGSSWREIHLDKACTSTWCGAPPNSPDNKYAIAWRTGKTYTIRIEGMKKSIVDDIVVKFNPEITWKGYKTDDFFTKLISNEVRPARGEAEFIIKNPTSFEVSAKTFVVNSFKEYGNNLNSLEYFILKNYTINVTDYKDVYVSETCYYMDTNSTPKNVSYECGRRTSEEIGYHDEYELVYEKWNPTGYKLFPGEHQIKIVGRWKAHLGEHAIEWIPEIEVEGVKFVQEKWAWWNESINNKEPVEVNQTGGTTLTNFVFLINGTEGLDTAAMIAAGDLDAGGYCMWLLDNSEATELPYKYENISSDTYGIDTANTLVWGEIDSLPTTNETLYLYYDDDCGASSTAEQMFTNYKSLFLMGEEQGTSVADTQGYNTLTSNNASAWEAGKFGYATHGGGTTLLNGTTQYNAYNGTTPFTVSFWYKVDVFDDDAYRVIWGQQISASTNGPYSRFSNGQDYIWAMNYPNNTALTLHSNESTPLTGGTWYLFTYIETTSELSWWICGGTEYPGCGVIEEVPTTLMPWWNGYNEYLKLYGSGYSNQYIAGALDSFGIMNATVDWGWQQRQYHQEYSTMAAGWLETNQDVTAPNVDFVSPSDANATEDAHEQYILWNMTVNENVGAGRFTINGTNQSCTGMNATTNSYCYYNETGLTTNVTRCADGWASDATNNWNHTDFTICRSTDIHITPLVIKIYYPENISYGSTTTWLNWTVDADISWCIYSLNGGTNTTDICVDGYEEIESSSMGTQISNPSNFIDSDWATYAEHVTSASTSNISYVNYTIPSAFSNLSKSSYRIKYYTMDGASSRLYVYLLNDTYSWVLIQSAAASGTTYDVEQNLDTHNATTNDSVIQIKLVTDSAAEKSLKFYEGELTYDDDVIPANVSITGVNGQNNITIWANNTLASPESLMNFTTQWFYINILTEAAVISPTNLTDYTSIPIALNVTTDIYTDACEYNLDGGANSSLSNDSMTNWYTEIRPTDGAKQLNLYCNASNLILNESIQFTLDTSPPTTTITSPLNKTYYSNQLPLGLNVTTNETAEACFWDINGTANVTMTNTSGTNWYGDLTVAPPENAHEIIYYCNDTAGNWNTTSIWFNYSSKTLNFTVALSNGINSFKLNFSTGTLTYNVTYQTVSWYNATPENQTASLGIWNVTNIGTAIPDVRIYLNQTVGCMSIWAMNDSTNLFHTVNAMNLTTSEQTINTSIAVGGDNMYWTWIDMVNCSVGTSFYDVVRFTGG